MDVFLARDNEYFFLVFLDRLSLYSPGCPGTHFVDQAGLELRNLPASSSRVLGLKVYTTTPSEPFLIEPYILYFSILRLCLIKTIIMRVNTGQRLCWLSFYFFCQCITLKTRSKSKNILKQNIIKTYTEFKSLSSTYVFHISPCMSN